MTRLNANADEGRAWGAGLTTGRVLAQSVPAPAVDVKTRALVRRLLADQVEVPPHHGKQSPLARPNRHDRISLSYPLDGFLVYEPTWAFSSRSDIGSLTGTFDRSDQNSK